MSGIIVGITVDNKDNTAGSGRYESSIAYSRAVALAGGLPVLLAQEISCVQQYVRLCDAIVFTGGVDPRMEAFGVAMHPKARPVDPMRQNFELALLAACDRQRDLPVLGVCLGMQFMALHAGGQLDQYLPDTLGEEAAKFHQADNRHAIVIHANDSRLLGDGDMVNGDSVVSWHRQAVQSPGRLRLLATAPDGVVEAIDDPSRLFYAGVQWHPERGGDGPLNLGIFQRLVAACRQKK